MAKRPKTVSSKPQEKKGRAKAATAARAPLQARQRGGKAAPAAVESLNRSLGAARAIKQDEFYTQLPDIEKELKHYTRHLEGKSVFCNCDDPKISNFFHYFSRKFRDLNLKRLVTTCYCNANPDLFSQHDNVHGVKLVYEGERTPEGRVPSLSRIGVHPLRGDGDFRSEECVALLKEADVVVTNPPFSLFRAYLGQLVKHGKKFLIIGNKNAITYKEVFSLIKENRMWVGNTAMGTDMLFRVSESLADTLIKEKKEGSAYRVVGGEILGRSQSCWFTNLDIAKRHEPLTLYKSFKADPCSYERFDNYDAINVDQTKNIPYDYDGVMGVPISFLDKYSPEQFEIVGMIAGNIKGLAGIPSASGKDGPYIGGRLRYG